MHMGAFDPCNVQVVMVFMTVCACSLKQEVTTVIWGQVEELSEEHLQLC